MMLYEVLAGLAGLALGMLVMYLMQKKQTGDQSVQALQSKLNDYQDQVEAHFAKTADLIDNLTNSYKDVFEHLSESAETLLTEEQIQNQLAHRNDREVTIKYLKQQQVVASESASFVKEESQVAETDAESEIEVEPEVDTESQEAVVSDSSKQSD